MEIPRGRGVPKAHFLNGKCDTKMEFPEGWGVQAQMKVGDATLLHGQ